MFADPLAEEQHHICRAATLPYSRHLQLCMHKSICENKTGLDEEFKSRLSSSKRDFYAVRCKCVDVLSLYCSIAP